MTPHSGYGRRTVATAAPPKSRAISGLGTLRRRAHLRKRLSHQESSSEALRKKPSHQEGPSGGPSCIVFGFLPRRPSEEHAVGQLDIQSQPYEGLNSKCLARIYANKQYTTSGGSGSRKRTHTNTKASKNYATKPPDEEPLTNILGSSGPTPLSTLGVTDPWPSGRAPVRGGSSSEHNKQRRGTFL